MAIQVRSRTRRTELSSSRDARPRHSESSIASRVDGGWWTRVWRSSACVSLERIPKKRRRRRRQRRARRRKSLKRRRRTPRRRRRRSRVRVKGTQRWRTLRRRRRRITPSRCSKILRMSSRGECRFRKSISTRAKSRLRTCDGESSYLRMCYPRLLFSPLRTRTVYCVAPTPPATCATSLAGFPIPSCACGI